MRTGLPRSRSEYLTKQLKTVADTNQDGKISRNEWQDWVDKCIKKTTKDAPGSGVFSKAMGGFMRVVAYAPTYSCCPPPLFVISITLLQVMFYLLR